MIPRKEIDRAKQELIPDLKIGTPVAYSRGNIQEIGVVAKYSSTGTIGVELCTIGYISDPYMKYIHREHTKRLIAVDVSALPSDVEKRVRETMTKYATR